MNSLDEKRFSIKDGILVVLLCIIVILVLVIIWALSTKTNEEFVAQFSFAATISSIILSVLAIFMSINGESRTTVIRDKIEVEADEMTSVSREMKELLRQLEVKIDSIKEGTEKVEAMLDSANKTVPVVQTHITGEKSTVVRDNNTGSYIVK